MLANRILICVFYSSSPYLLSKTQYTILLWQFTDKVKSVN